MAHVEDLPVVSSVADVSPSDADAAPSFLNGIISINERDSFRSKLILE